MLKRKNYDVWGIEEEGKEDGNGGMLSCIAVSDAEFEFEDEYVFKYVDEDVDEDEDEDEFDEDEDEFVEYENVGHVYKDEVDVDISEIAVDDGRLFPNKSQDYYDTIKLIVHHEYHRTEPPVCIFGNYIPYIDEPKYKSGTHPMTTGGRIQLGQQLDVVSLSSSHWRLLRVGNSNTDYIEPKTLKGKYVVLVCVFAPLRWLEYDTQRMCHLQILSNLLSKARNFEMVFIPKMRRDVGPASSKAAFDTLLSAFPGRLFVPFEDEAVRDKICQRLHFRGPIKTLLVDPTSKVAQDNVFDMVANRHYPPSPSQSSNNNDNNINTEVEFLTPDWIVPPTPLGVLRDKCLSSTLAELLDPFYCDPTLCLHSLASSGSSSETITVGELSNKLVGIYLYLIGDKLDSFLDVYNQCREKGLGFEIVVVCISLFTSLDPLVFYRYAIDELKRRIPETPWWVLPYNPVTHSILYKLSMDWGNDTMFTVGPSRKLFVDVHGGQVARCFGIQAYPFNREMVVRKYELGAKAITLDSLLSRGPVDYVLRGGERVRVADLYDKVVVVYSDFGLDYDSGTYKSLSRWHQEIRKQHSGFEVVFVQYDEEEEAQGSSSNAVKKQPSGGIMDLLVRPFDPEHSSFWRKHESLFMGENGHGYPVDGLRPQSTLLFGKGGRLCALNALRRFESYGLVGYPYESGCGDKYIRGEITKSLAFQLSDFMCGYGNQKPYDVVSLD